MKQMIFCQSCGMPLQANEDHGTNSDGTMNPEYCQYCYKEGKFTADCTMDEMIDHCAQFVDKMNEGSEHKITKEQAIAHMKEQFPKFKRWSQK